ncbi:MAG TPA: choice-of-anchor Q domain-containing protein [Candidatus Solibacter sp.]|nr:choice-of-anchor Q domain-containing protein [Candidatus Solibacter sp.]
MAVAFSFLTAASAFIASNSLGQASAIVATTTDDPALGSTSCPAAVNPCSLRAAVARANTVGGTNTISFGVDGVFKVTGTSGGQIEIKNSPVQNLTIIGNGAAKTIIDGQGEDHRILLTDDGATVAISGVTIRNAHGLAGLPEDGLAINSNGSLTITSVAITGNELDATGASASFGGAGIVASGPLTVIDSAITGNTLHADVTGRTGGSASGAGIFLCPQVRPAPVVLSNTVVSGNAITATGAGGGGFNAIGAGIDAEYICEAPNASNTVTIDSSTVSGNSIIDHSTGGTNLVAGGGLTTDRAQSTSIVNSTVDGNTLSSDHGPTRGGGVVVAQSQTANMTNLTISSNVAVTGEALDSEQNAIHLRSTILSSASASGCSTTSGGTIVSDGDNLDSGSSCGLGQATDQHGVDPLLGALQDNGGLTQTRALLSGSPAINAVAASDCPPPVVDQRGVSRPQGPRCDIGAFELPQAAAGAAPAAAPLLPRAGAKVSGSAAVQGGFGAVVFVAAIALFGIRSNHGRLGSKPPSAAPSPQATLD